jgi:hypothetical protein
LACGSRRPEPPSYGELRIEPRTLPVEAGVYGGLAWLADNAIALTVSGRRPAITIVDRGGRLVREVTPERPDCDLREFMALATTVEGGLGVADVCDDPGMPDAIQFVDIDAESGRETDRMGPAVAVPFDAAWAANGSVIHSTGDGICTTLYRMRDSDRPLVLDVTVGGQSFAVGQDLTGLAEPCPSGGRAGYPAITRDGSRLSFLASSNGEAVGQVLIDRPWALFVLDNDRPLEVIAGITDPRDITWTADGMAIVFAGRVFERDGVWSVKADGSALTLISALSADRLTSSPDGKMIAAIRSRLNASGGLAEQSEIMLMDLPAK